MADLVYHSIPPCTANYTCYTSSFSSYSILIGQLQINFKDCVNSEPKQGKTALCAFFFALAYFGFAK